MIELRFIHILYYQQEAGIRIRDKVSEMVPMKGAARRGCVLSPDLFSF